MDQQVLAYKKNAKEAAERLSLLWSRKAQDKIFAHMSVPTKTLTEFAANNVDGTTTYPDPKERIKFWDSYLSEMADLEDDSLPIAYLSEFDQGVYAGALGAPMSYMMHKNVGWVSSMCPPILDDLAHLDEFIAKHVGFLPGNDGPVRLPALPGTIKLMDEQVKIFADGARGKFGIAPFIVIDSMNFVSELRGATSSFEDTFDYPEQTKRLMDFAYDLNVFIQSRVQQATDTFMGGSFVNMGTWAPGNPILFSVDAYHLARPDFYYEWGEPHLQRLLDHFGGGLLHIHSNGRHLIEHVNSLRGLVCIYLLNEDWSIRAYDELDRMKSLAGDVPILIDCRADEFERDMDAGKLPGNVLYKVTNLPSTNEANRLMGKVRKYLSKS